MILSKTPLRISFVGGGSDLPAFYERSYGAVVSSAIDKFVYIAVHKFFEQRYVLKYSQTEVCEKLEEIQHPLIRECLRATGTPPPLEITSIADIPSTGSGLGSSSAFAVGLLNTLGAYQGRMPSHDTCASQACEVEIERLGEPIGKQDQYAAAFGGCNYIRFNADGSVHVDPIILPRETRLGLEQRLVMFYTGVSRKASSILGAQKQNIASSSAHFEILRLMRDQADVLRAELGRGNIEAIGELMHAGWNLKRQMAAGISNPAFDDIYNRARSVGVKGGKLLGAGGGGFFLFYCEPGLHTELAAALPDLKRVDFHLERQGTRITYIGD
jgi:D-glycero-alpha-D-manno-heptose-7-phosphate kinase